MHKPIRPLPTRLDGPPAQLGARCREIPTSCHLERDILAQLAERHAPTGASAENERYHCTKRRRELDVEIQAARK